MNLGCRLRRTSIPRKRRGNHSNSRSTCVCGLEISKSYVLTLTLRRFTKCLACFVLSTSCSQSRCAWSNTCGLIVLYWVLEARIKLSSFDFFSNKAATLPRRSTESARRAMFNTGVTPKSGMRHLFKCLNLAIVTLDTSCCSRGKAGF